MLLFALQRALAPPPAGRRLDVSAQVIAGLRADHQRRTGAPPTAAEEKLLIDRYVDAELQYREALALGLDRGDVIVRRRLVQKMQFLGEELEPLAEPDDEELTRYLDEHRARYAAPDRVSIEQMFVARDRHGAHTERDALVLGERLRAGAAAATLGDPFVHGRIFAARSQAELASLFGAPFAAAVFALDGDGWSTPLSSSYGLHLVRVTGRRTLAVVTLDDVRERVTRDWRADQRGRRERRALDRLRARYDVRIEARR